jgi:hypothetical protein
VSYILILGAPNTGKTVYGAQFYLRAQYGAYLSATGEAEDLSIFHAAIETILQGKKPERTKIADDQTLTLTVTNPAGQHLTLEWPDYAGEVFKAVLDRRVLTPTWTDRVQRSAGLLLIIRPEAVRTAPDALDARVHSDPPQDSSAANTALTEVQVQASPSLPLESTGPVALQPDAQYVELLQLIRYARKEARLTRSEWPLMILLSCWDEIMEPGTPTEELQRHCPLLASYLAGAWEESSLQVIGLSALGQAFAANKDVVNTGFLEKRPEERGYVVTPENLQDPDLTKPVAWLLERINAHQS